MDLESPRLHETPDVDDQVVFRLRPLQEGAAVQPQRLDDAPLGLFNQAVHLVGRDVDEAGREVGEKRLEPQLGVFRDAE